MSEPRRRVWWWARPERRREERQPAPRLSVDSPAVRVELLDASETGLGVITRRPLKIGVLYPFLVHCGDQRCEVYGLVRWCQTEGTDRFRCGISVGKTVGPPLLHLAA